MFEKVLIFKINLLFCQHCCNILDHEHMNADGYLRPIESPRSPTESFASPPPPYSAYLRQRDTDNKFFGSDTSLEENSVKKGDGKEVVYLGKNRLNSISEMKAKVSHSSPTFFYKLDNTISYKSWSKTENYISRVSESFISQLFLSQSGPERERNCCLSNGRMRIQWWHTIIDSCTTILL